MTTTVTIPTLETDRLILRAPRIEDFADFARFYSSDRADARGWKRSADAAAHLYAKVLEYWCNHNFGWFVLTTKDTKKSIGTAGCWQPDNQPELSFDWTIWNALDEGAGYAYEAAIAVREYAAGIKPSCSLVSYIHPENLRSIKLAERLGAKIDGQWTTPSGKLVDIWRHPSEVLA